MKTLFAEPFDSLYYKRAILSLLRDLAFSVDTPDLQSIHLTVTLLLLSSSLRLIMLVVNSKSQFFNRNEENYVLVLF